MQKQSKIICLIMLLMLLSNYHKLNNTVEAQSLNSSTVLLPSGAKFEKLLQD